ncbi:MAG: prepilin-type N-terminal cleavage/methylation domain-containing protein [Pseudomonadales bacterium]|jgi:prepilin-type N-terminal cleavage/methylation domain-containing protein|nr:prepilin-type N-terminal cleavage/methylation domain-containing protein [Pseudomonadales bacterium]
MTVHQRGVTLLELMITVVIVAIVATLAISGYNGYVATAREAVLGQNIDTMRVFQEDFRLRTGAYSGEDWAPGDGETETGWLPQQDGRNVSYVVTVAGNQYTVVATDGDTGTIITRTFP